MEIEDMKKQQIEFKGLYVYDVPDPVGRSAMIGYILDRLLHDEWHKVGAPEGWYPPDDVMERCRSTAIDAVDKAISEKAGNITPDGPGDSQALDQILTTAADIAWTEDEGGLDRALKQFAADGFHEWPGDVAAPMDGYEYRFYGPLIYSKPAYDPGARGEGNQNR